MYPAYPTYDVSVRWSQDMTGKEYERQGKDLPDGRLWNGTSWRRMYRVNPGVELIRADCEKWWETYASKGQNPSYPEFEIAERMPEEWCLTWFSHYTFDIGQSDDEALRSFEQFLVRQGVRVSWCNDGYGYTPRHDDPDSYVDMGASDRWRWCGRTHDGPDREQTPPPCRCASCKALGLIRIDH